MPSNPAPMLMEEEWMAERQNVESRKAETEKRGAERGLDEANGERINGSSAQTVSAGLIDSEIWNRATDSACQEVSATIESSGAAMRGLCEMQTQWWSFLERTLRSSLDASQRFKACNDYAEVLEHQRQFVEDRVRDLMTETTEMLRISSRLATSSIEPFTARWNSGKPAARN